MELQIDMEVSQLPEEEKRILSKCLKRFRDGDIDGSVAAICSLVDSLTESIYEETADLGEHRNDTYQQRINRAFSTKEEVILSSLRTGGFSDRESSLVWHNLRGAVNQAGFVLGTFRREISDVHGTKSAAPAVVQRALDAAVFIVRSFVG